MLTTGSLISVGGSTSVITSATIVNEHHCYVARRNLGQHMVHTVLLLCVCIFILPRRAYCNRCSHVANLLNIVSRDMLITLLCYKCERAGETVIILSMATDVSCPILA